MNTTWLTPLRTSAANSANDSARVALRMAFGAQPCPRPVAVQLQRVQHSAVLFEKELHQGRVAGLADPGEIPHGVIEDEQRLLLGAEIVQNLAERVDAARLAAAGERSQPGEPLPGPCVMQVVDAQMKEAVMVGDCPLERDGRPGSGEEALQLQAGLDVVVIGDRHDRGQAEVLIDLRHFRFEQRAGRQGWMPPPFREVDGRAVLNGTGLELAFEIGADQRNLRDVDRQIGSDLAGVRGVGVQRHDRSKGAPLSAAGELPKADLWLAALASGYCHVGPHDIEVVRQRCDARGNIL
jgi:hypothetical protein